MDSDTIWKHIDTQRGELADLLAELPEESWGRPSLCHGWTVRDVAAHLAQAQTRLRDVIRPAVRAGFRYNAAIKLAALRSPLSHQEIIATLRGFVGSRRTAPFVTELEPLLDILVHTQDICAPLGIAREMPLDAAAAAADRVLALRGLMRLWKPPTDRRLVATDVDWSYGQGPAVEAPMASLLLMLTGRTS